MITAQQKQIATILTIESSQSHNINSMLKQTNNNIIQQNSIEKIMQIADSEQINLVVCDANDWDENEVQIIKNFKRKNKQTEFIIIIHEKSTLINKFNNDFIIINAPFDANQFLNTVDRIIENSNLSQELLNLRGQVAMSYGFDNIVGISESIKNIKETIMKISPTEIYIHLTGPYGTGKKQLAHTIHYHSKRRKERFITLDCSILPQNMIETELFGTATISDNVENPRLKSNNSTSSNQSLLEKADGGTLFINEIHLMPENTQRQLIMFLKTFEINSSTSNQKSKADIRLITSSPEKLEQLTANGKFSSELFNLINVFPIATLPLNKRLEDIELLVDYFLRTFAYQTNSQTMKLSRSALDKIRKYDWPGNVQELENTLLRAGALCHEQIIEADDIRFMNEQEIVTPQTISKNKPVNESGKTGLLSDNQKTVIKDALENNNWNFTQTAVELGIGRTTLWRKVKKFQLKRGPEEVEN
ncbi:MAG: sigma 54-interacting transcriptional regulator [candidate division Zixibacteria bacterium]|nr:sigma 54-interacting transcriptional regulator [candidate division Zixibacteria bacterium]